MILKAEKDEEKPRMLMPKCLMNQSQPASRPAGKAGGTDNVEEDDPGERRESIEEEDTIKDLD